MKEGPSEFVIPEQRGLTCTGCKWLRQGIQLDHHKPFTSYRCMLHELPDAPPYKGQPVQFNFWDHSITPGEWCPFPVTEG